MTSSVATMMPPRTRCLVTVRTYAERERFMQRRQQLEQQHAAQVSAGLALSAARERGLRVERDRQDSQEAEREVTRLVRRNGPRHPPPPPPPAQVGRVAVVAAWRKSPPKVDGEGAAQDMPAPPAMPPAVPAAAAPTAAAPPSSTQQAVAPAAPTTTLSASTTVAVSGRTSPSKAAPKVLAKPPLPSATTNGAVNGTVNGGHAATNANLLAIQQSRLKPVHHHLLQQQKQQQAPPPPPSQQQLRVTHRTPSPAPYCPTPDYDSDSSGSTLHTASTAWTAHAVSEAPVAASATASATAASAANGVVPEVEMQSLDSLELLEPRARQPRPPQTYFQQNRVSTAARPSVCVTIREYGGAPSRQPAKLTFLNGQQQQPQQPQQQQQQQPEACGLQSELAATLSRSNLRSRSDVVDAAKETSTDASKPSEDVTRGNVTVTSVNGSRAAADSYLPKSSVPNGILKKTSVTHMAGPVGHGLTPAMLAGAGAALKPKSSGVATKTISFGAKATIINEKPVST